MSPVVVTQPPETLHLCQQPPRVPRQEQGHLCRWPHSRTGEPSVLRQKEKHQHGAWQQVLAPAEDSCASYPKSLSPFWQLHPNFPEEPKPPKTAASSVVLPLVPSTCVFYHLCHPCLFLSGPSVPERSTAFPKSVRTRSETSGRAAAAV